MKIYNPIANLNQLALLTTTLIFTSLTGCQSYSPFNTSDQLVRVNPTQLSKYWVVKDKALDWRTIYIEQPNLQSATISFEINSEGDMVNLAIEELEDNTDMYKQLLTQLSTQKFSSTSAHSNTQPVLVNAIIFPK